MYDLNIKIRLIYYNFDIFLYIFSVIDNNLYIMCVYKKVERVNKRWCNIEMIIVVDVYF